MVAPRTRSRSSLPEDVGREIDTSSRCASLADDGFTGRPDRLGVSEEVRYASGEVIGTESALEVPGVAVRARIAGLEVDRQNVRPS